MRHRLLCATLIAACTLSATLWAQTGLSPEAQQSFDRGMAAAQQKDWNTAIAEFSAAQKLAPNEPRVLFNLGLAHEKAGHTVDALLWFATYLKVAPDAPNAPVIRKEIERLSHADRAAQPAAVGPTLEETLRFIQERINEQGTIVFTETLTVNNRVNRLVVNEEPKVTAILPAGGVTIQINGHSSFLGTLKYPSDTTAQWNLLFKDLESVDVLGMEQALSRSLARSGLNNAYAQIGGAVFTVVVRLAPGRTVFLNSQMLVRKDAKQAKTARSTDWSKDFSKPLSGELLDCAIPFRDGETAQRVARAMMHAAELARATAAPDPF